MKAVLDATLPAQLSTREGAGSLASVRRTSVWEERWLTLLWVTLLGYALLGKGWAYIGVPPLFIGEAVLFCGLVLFVFTGRWRGLLDLGPVWFLLLLVAWGLCRIVPDLARYGVEALRDAVIWGYSLLAAVVFAAIRSRPARLVALLNRYRQFAAIFPVFVPVIWAATRIYPRPVIPNWPWVDVPILVTKGGDIQVHFAGILAFWVAGFAGSISLARLGLFAFGLGLVGTFDRAGLLSFLTIFAVCFFFKPQDRLLWRLLALWVIGLALLVASNVHVQMPGREREISAAQFVANFSSLVGASRTGDLDETKDWRLQWWSDIYAYTVGGRYFWTGKGFGINLADDDDFQVEEDGSLRNPHNGHLTMLARGGVPGFALWILVQLSWAFAVFGALVRSRRRGDRTWPELFFFLLAYWMAFMINASFDVFLEGPMGGIWYWTLYGVGLAALWLYKNNPAALDGAACGEADCQRAKS